MESAKCTIKEAVQAIQELGFGEDTCNLNQYIKKECKTMTFENNKYRKARYFTGCVSHVSKFSGHI